MAKYYVKRECWQRVPNRLIMVHETDDGTKRQVRFIPEITTHLRFDGLMWQCTNCGTALASGLNYCPWCGARIETKE